ncbi:MAG: hypothetical protein Q3965_02425 [Rothia sp. (in: high G+C Gram-positive bacteria)]|nr:hypothetical protein [Rothia sp. (in: high G+C Gram-positive bacteria)]
MYGWIFRHLPGPLWLRIMVALALILLVIYLLVEYAFPYLAEYSPLTTGATIEQ